ncbi:putative lipoprotein, partial [Burkholderia multivorans ATCC BAA-247]
MSARGTRPSAAWLGALAALALALAIALGCLQPRPA